MIIRKRGDWLAARVGDDLVMMSAEKGTYIGLSGAGVRIWELIESPQPVDVICERLVQEFEVTPEVCQADVDEFLTDLERQGAIAFDPPSGA